MDDSRSTVMGYRSNYSDGEDRYRCIRKKKKKRKKNEDNNDRINRLIDNRIGAIIFFFYFYV